MNLLLGPTLRLILGPANVGSLNVTVLDKWSPADLSSLIECDLLVLDEAVLPEVFIAFFFLLGLVLCYIGGVAPLVIRVITLHHLIVLSLLNHLHLVDTPLAITTRTGSGNSRERDIITSHSTLTILSVIP